FTVSSHQYEVTVIRDEDLAVVFPILRDLTASGCNECIIFRWLCFDSAASWFLSWDWGFWHQSLELIWRNKKPTVRVTRAVKVLQLHHALNTRLKLFANFIKQIIQGRV